MDNAPRCDDCGTLLVVDTARPAVILFACTMCGKLWFAWTDYATNDPIDAYDRSQIDKGSRVMYYTLGHSKGYAKISDGTEKAWKAVGGWALILDQAIDIRHKLHTDPQFRRSHGLPAGEYTIFELPECKPEMVWNDRLLADTPIGMPVTVTEIRMGRRHGKEWERNESNSG